MPPPSQKRSFLPVDSLSNLPPEIIASILGRLPIRRAIQTCILSRQWRYKWCSMTRLYFDEDCVSFPDNDNDSLFYNLLASFIDRVLLYHQGQVHEFTIFSDHEPYSSDLNQWVYFASQNNVRKLKLSFRCDVMAPSSLFRCSKLMSLDLGPFVILELPVGFDGFMYLKTLHFNGLVILASSLEKLIAGCPFLESLEINECYLEFFRVHAPLLKYLHLDIEVEGFFLEKTPLLRELTVSINCHPHNDREGTVSKFLGHVPSLEKLVGYGHFVKHWSQADDSATSGITHYHLRFIDLFLNFEDPTEVLSLLKLMDRSPVLEDICIRSDDRGTSPEVALDSEFWSKVVDVGCEFLQLRKVRVTAGGSTEETKFMKFLLLHSPALEELQVNLWYSQGDSRKEVVAELLRCRRAYRSRCFLSTRGPQQIYACNGFWTYLYI